MPTLDDQATDLVKALRGIQVAVGSLNPDPKQTIGQYRRSRRLTFGLAIYSAVLSTVLALSRIV
jgi:hypothetical protein